MRVAVNVLAQKLGMFVQKLLDFVAGGSIFMHYRIKQQFFNETALQF